MIHFDQDRLIKRINEIQSLMMQENFWDDNRLAKSLIDEQNHSRDLLDTYKDVKTKIENLDDSINLLKDEYDKELHELLSEEFVETIKDVEKFEIKVLLNDPLDAKNAILEFHPGAGGTESQDWASMFIGCMLDMLKEIILMLRLWTTKAAMKLGLKVLQ